MLPLKSYFLLLPQAIHAASLPAPSLGSQLTHEVVVPGSLCWNHEEAKESI